MDHDTDCVPPVDYARFWYSALVPDNIYLKSIESFLIRNGFAIVSSFRFASKGWKFVLSNKTAVLMFDDGSVSTEGKVTAIFQQQLLSLQGLVPPSAAFVKSRDTNICNLCKAALTGGQALTWDHVPPEGCLESKVLTVQPFLAPVKGTIVSQSGISFRSLCPSCNNDELGAKVDPCLISLSRSVRDWYASSRTSPPSFQCDVTSILRAVVGHALATLPYTPTTTLDCDMREYFWGRGPLNFAVRFWTNADHWVRVMPSGLFVDTNRPKRADFFYYLSWNPLSFFISKATDRLKTLPALDPGASSVQARHLASGVFEAWLYDQTFMFGENKRTSVSGEVAG